MRRKGKEECAIEYYEELERMKMCTNNGRGQIFATHADRGEREQYHYRNEMGEYRNNNEPGEIDRRTLYGSGIPQNDKRLF